MATEGELLEHQHMRIKQYEAALTQSQAENERLRAEIERLQAANDGQAQAIGNQTKTIQQLRHEIERLKLKLTLTRMCTSIVDKAPEQMAPAKLSGDHLPEAQQDARPSVSHPYDY